MKKEKVSISAYGAFTDGEEIWIPSNEYNALFYMKIGDQKAKYILKFENLVNDEAWKIGKVISYKEELFFFSRYAYEIWILDKNSLELKSITFSDGGHQPSSNVSVYNNEAWIFPSTLEMPIIIFDLSEKKVIKEVSWGNYADNQISEQSYILRSVVYADSIYTATREKNNIHICKIDCNTKSIAFYKVEEAEFISCISVEKDGVWLFIKSQEGKAILECYDLSFNRKIYSKEVKNAGIWPDGVQLPYFKTVHYKEWIILIPALAQELVACNRNTQEERLLLHSESDLSPRSEKAGAMFFECQRINNKVYLYPLRKDGMLELELEQLSLKKVDVSCSYDDYMISSIQSSNILMESSSLKLENLCSFLKTQDATKVEHQNRTDYGERIYENLTKRYI